MFIWVLSHPFFLKQIFFFFETKVLSYPKFEKYTQDLFNIA